MNVFPQQSDHPLFRYFTAEERTRVEDLGLVRKVREGDLLISAGDHDSTRRCLVVVGRLDGHGDRGKGLGRYT